MNDPHSTVNRKIRQAIALPIVLLAVLAGALSVQVIQLRESAAWVDHTDQVIAGLNHVSKLLSDIEAGFRGYLLTGRAEFREPYDQSLGALGSQLDGLERLVSDNPEQIRSLGVLRTEIKEWLDYTRAQMHNVPLRKANTSLLNRDGKIQMDTMRQDLARMLKREESLRLQREQADGRNVRSTWAILLGTIALLALVLSSQTARALHMVRRKYQEVLDHLSESRERLRSLFYGLRDYGVCLLDENGGTLEWNPAAEKITGYSEAEMLGQSFGRLFPAEESDSVTKLLAQARTHGQAATEGWRVRKDGSRFWIDTVVCGLYDSQQKLRGFSSVFRDLTARRQIEEERAFTLLKLKEAVHARDEFLSLASHELRTPLTSISLQVQMLRRSKQTGPDGTLQIKSSTVEILQRQIARMERLIEDMLDVARIHSGRMSLNFKRVDLSKMVEKIISDFGDQFTRSGCPLELNAEPNITGDWDEFRLEQVIINFLSNALRYGCGKPIHVRVKKTEDRAQVGVKDFGPGIPPEHHQHIFERFGRGSKSQEFGGLGLGLFISRQIAEAHGGTIQLRSEPGNGAEFILDIPLVEPRI